MVFQGPAKEVSDYFNMGTTTGSKNVNPCDFFMRKLSINYPKEAEDEEKLQFYLEKY